MRNNYTSDRLSPFVSTGQDLFAKNAILSGGLSQVNLDKVLLYVGKSPIGICTRLDYPGLALESANKTLNWLNLRIENYYTLPYAIICDTDLPESELDQIVSFVNSTPRIQDTPILFFSREEKTSSVEKASRLKADDLFFESDDIEDVLYRIESIKKLKKLQQELLVKVDEVGTYPRNTFTIKRVIDIMLSSMALLAFSPFFIIIAAIIRLESKGSVFYIAPRAGFDYKIFPLYKFRTMVADADKKVQELAKKHNQYSDENAVFFKFKSDPRITKVGAFLRKTSLDEIPQLINVLKGDMSLVGNRPLPLYEAEQLTQDEYAERFLAPAGITGLWQVKKRGRGDMSARERIKLDKFYAKNKSLKMDLWIMTKTIPAMLQKEDV
ncbi:sugar transferase (plasmid) [Flammeovirgaceae bacterium SG7u.111]|nr:sugar transferase [Flammeovirgaceae bacterium SG7u.132]WPO38823.1 sugar transferase [Flammeovirgaceae bacterium SG7u.111]